MLKNNSSNNTINISGVSVKYACVCVPPQACIKTPSTILHTSCLSVFCAALSAPRPACLSRRARSLQNDILPAKTARIRILSEPLIETLWLQIGGGCAPPNLPLSFSALPRPRVYEKLRGGFSTLAKVKNRNWQMRVRVPDM